MPKDPKCTPCNSQGLVLSDTKDFYGNSMYDTCPCVTSVKAVEEALRCTRCALGIDDDQDGDCSICASMTDLQARKVKTGVQQLCQ